MLNLRHILYSLLILRSTISVEFRLHPGTFTRSPSDEIFIRQKRETTSNNDPNFSWKLTKTPPFVTNQMKSQRTKPILTVFPSVHPSEGTFRHGKSHEIPLQEYNNAKRVVYYSVLPDVSHQLSQPPYNPLSEIVELSTPLRSNQRSYNGNNAGKNFVTKVQSSIINVSGEDKNKDTKKTNPSFTIIETPASQYSINNVNRPTNYPINYLSNHMTGIDYHQSYYPSYHHKPYKLPYSSSLPYYSPGNGIGLSQQYYQHQSSPYYEEVEKVHASGHEHQHQNHIQHLTSIVPHKSPTFPTRHLRFPSNRYSLGSPFSDLLSSSRPFTSPVSSIPLDSSFPEHSSNLGLGENLSSNRYSLHLNDNLGPVTMDHNLDFDNDKPLSFKDKFPNFNKYPDASDGFNSPFFKPQSSESLLGDETFDMEALQLAAAAMGDKITGDKGLYVKGSLLSNGGQNQNNSTVSPSSEFDNTTPSPIALWNAMTEDTETEIPLERRET